MPSGTTRRRSPRRMLNRERHELLVTLAKAWWNVPSAERHAFDVEFQSSVAFGDSHTRPWAPPVLKHPGLRGGRIQPDWRYVRALVQQGLLQFRAKERYGRAFCVELTPEGFEIAENPQPSAPQTNGATPRKPRLFIVHGRDHTTKLEVKNFLQNDLDLPEPLVLHEEPDRGRTIIEKFEDCAKVVDGAVVLLTPDDHHFEPDGSNQGSAKNDQLRRARQNVILELGYFLAKFGRSSGKVLLLYKGELDIPSDLSGTIYIVITNGVHTAEGKIRRELGLR